MTATSTFWFRCLDKLSNPLASIGYGNRCRHQTMYQMGTPCWIHVNITWIRRRPNFDEFPCHFHILFQYNFSDQIITSFPWIFFDIILMIEKSTSFPCTFFGLVSLVEKFLTQFRWSNIPNIHAFHVLFLLQFQWSKNPRRFHVIFPTWFYWSKNPHCFHVLFSV